MGEFRLARFENLHFEAAKRTREKGQTPLPI
jgi:hypothetical protein